MSLEVSARPAGHQMDLAADFSQPDFVASHASDLGRRAGPVCTWQSCTPPGQYVDLFSFMSRRSYKGLRSASLCVGKEYKGHRKL